MITLKSLPAIAQLEAVLTKNLLAGDDPARCKALIKVLKASTDGRLRYDAVLAAVFPDGHQPANPGNVFTKFRQRVGAAAQEAGIAFEMQVTGSKRSGAASMWLTFHGDDAANGQLPMEASPTHDPKVYAPQMARRDVKRIFLSNADLDGELVAQFLKCLRTSMASDGDSRIHEWASSIFWHRVDLTDNQQQQAIHRAIDDCDVGLILFSRNLIASSFVRGEELPRFQPSKWSDGDPRARPAIAVQLTNEPIDRLHSAVGHKEFTYRNCVDDHSEKRCSFELGNSTQRNRLCDQIVEKLKEYLLPSDDGGDSVSPSLRKRRQKVNTPSEHLPLPCADDRYNEVQYDATAVARATAIRRAGGHNVATSGEGAPDANTAVSKSASTDVPALEYLSTWATEANRSRWFAVLGELGMGKTFLCRMLANRLRNTPDAPRPIYVDLRSSATDAANGARLTLELILQNSLRVDYSSPKSFTPETLIDGVRKRGDVIIFDGLDELSVHLKDEGTRALIAELLSVLPPTLEASTNRSSEESPTAAKQIDGKRRASSSKAEKLGKVVISCRTHYFPDITSQNAFLLQAHRGKADGEDVEAFTLLPFTEEAIRRYFRNALGTDKADSAFELISEVHNLRELAERPYLLSLITGQIGKLEVMRQRGETVNAASLYGLFADDWLQRDTGKHEFELAHKRSVMQALAAEMWRERARQWSWERMERWLNEFMLSVPGWVFRYAAKADVLAKDLRTATFIVRVGEDSFRFAHTSLQEYFLSGYLLDALTARELSKWDNLVPSDETFDFMWQRWQLMANGVQRTVVDGLHDLLARAKPARGAVAPLIAWQLYVLRQAENPAAIVNLDGADVRGWRLAGTADRPMRLPNLTLRDAVAKALTVSHVDAVAVDASRAHLVQARFGDCDFQRADIRDADLRGSTWRNVDLRDARVDGGMLAGALFDQCDVSGISIDTSHPSSAGTFVLLNPKHSPPITTFERVDVACDRRAVVAAGHTHSVSCVAFSADGQTLASGSWDTTVKLWDVATGREKFSLAGHTDWVLSVAFSADGQTLASGSCDNTVKLWDVMTGREKLSMTGHWDWGSSVAFSADGQTLASGSGDRTVKLWDVATGREKLSLAGHSDSVWSVAFSADGQTLSSGSGDRTIKLWDVATGREKLSLAGHTDSVRSVAFSADGQTLASGSEDNTVKLWDVATGREKLSLAEHTDSVRSVAFSADGQTLASGSADKTVKLWDAATGREKLSLAGRRNSISSVAFSADRRTLACGSWDNTVKVWDLASGRELLSLVGHQSFVWSIAFSVDGQTLASGSLDSTVKLWDVATGREKLSLAGHTHSVSCVAFSADGQTLASGSWDTTVKLWDVATGREKFSLAGHTDWVLSVAFSADGQTLASGSCDNTVKLWDVMTGREKLSMTGHWDWGSSVAFSADGQTLASGSEDKTVKLWDVATGRVKRALAGHTKSVSCVAFSADGQTLASGSSDMTVKLWDVATGREKLRLAGHQDLVTSVAFSADGQTLASGSTDNSVKLWDVSTGWARRSFVSLPRGEWVTLDESVSDARERGLPVIAASNQAPHYLRQQWRNPATGKLAWMPWAPPGSELWVSVGGGNDPKHALFAAVNLHSEHDR
ncbi:MAG: pentapeptide repeat-containing protein [Casimicrobium sp.]